MWVILVLPQLHYSLVSLYHKGKDTQPYLLNTAFKSHGLYPEFIQGPNFTQLVTPLEGIVGRQSGYRES